MSADLEDPRLERLTAICLELPEAVREPAGQHAAFLVRGKKFAYYLDDHHGDGRVALTCRVSPGQHEALRDSGDKRFFVPAYLGPRGWIGIRLDLGSIDWIEIGDY